MTGPAASPARMLGVFAIGTFLAGGLLKIGLFDPPSASLDASWVVAIGDAVARGDRFGRDIIFTGGPLSSLYSRYFNPVTWPWVMVFGVLAAVSFGASLASLRPRWSAIVIVAVACANASIDAVLIGLPVLGALAAVATRGGRGRPALVLAAAASAGLVTAKFSVFPMALVAFGAADLVTLRAGRLPVGIATFTASLLAVFALANGDLADFPAYVRYSLDVAAGHMAAMSSTGPGLELVSFVILAALLSAVIAYDQLFRQGKPRLERAVVVLLLLIYLYMSFKAGFVRHDLHAQHGWTGLAFACAFYLCVFPPGGWPHRASAMMCMVAVLASLQMAGTERGLSWRAVLAGNADQTLASWRSLGRLVLDRRRWVADLTAGNRSAWAAIRAAYPLPALEGSVDIVPSEQAMIIAAGLDYRPHFTVQEYVSYTPTLIAKDRESLERPDGPRHVLFAARTIDGRYPASSSEGASWPAFLRLYRPGDRIRDLLLLNRRRTPAGEILGPEQTSTGTLSQAVAVPFPAAFVKMRIRMTLLGKALWLAFRPPQVSLTVHLQDGRDERYRLIPGQAEAGFLISPRISTSDEFLAFWPGTRGAVTPPRVVSFTIDSNRLGHWAYERAIDLTFQPIDTRALGNAALGTGD